MTSSSARPTDFSATDSALGYLYQTRLALWYSLRRLADNDPFSVFIETLDDVVFENSDETSELIQLKHHRRAASLTDASPDLWKTLRVWMEGRARGLIPDGNQLFLVTTSEATEPSAASMLLAENRDITQAADRLSITANTSSNQANAPAYELFQTLKAEERVALLRSVVVVPRSPSIAAVDGPLRQETRTMVRREHLEPFLSRLEGWWFVRVLRQLIATDTPPILSDELESMIDDLRDQFKLNSLPVDQDILEAGSTVGAEAFADAIFVHQAKLAGVGSQRVLAAIRDYHRAFEQRSRWVREELLLVGELDRYEQHLIEEWQLTFHRMADEIGDAAADDAKRKAAQRVYTWVEESGFPIREGVQHPSLSRGSLHMLAEQMRMGWHPEFVSRLTHLLEQRLAS